LLAPDTTVQGQSSSTTPKVFWGGPDRPSRSLRNLLEERIHAVPAGGEILWVTYYFRDENLAMALLQARQRGVRVRVAIEGNPRTGNVNSPVRKILEGASGLGPGFRAIRHRLFDNRYFRTGRLHEKLYYFSHPVPGVLVGTFNPSGSLTEDPEIIKKIGDQDRGHNVLVEILDSILVEGLYDHANHLFSTHHGPWERYLKRNNKVVTSGKTRILFFPRSRWDDFDEIFEGLEAGSTIQMAVSHLNDHRICKRMFGLAHQGVQIEILAHDTQRRVPSWVEKQMLQNGITFKRCVLPEKLPMHNKFMLLKSPGRCIVAFGSMNLSVRSLYANHELLVISNDYDLYQAFQCRWDEMRQEIRIF
jgi:phosphatidylserine/phosphatidylglycerophosphate/cardiolipin synthase-like enzyme